MIFFLFYFYFYFFFKKKKNYSKERVAAALENSHLLKVVNQCLIERELN